MKKHQNTCDNITITINNGVNKNFPNVTQDFPNVTQDFPKSAKNFPNVTHDFPNVTQDFPNVTHDFPNVTHDVIPSENGQEEDAYVYNKETKKYECLHCYKTYVSKYRIQKHYCQKIQDPYECPTCHMVLSSRNCKYKHMKHCIPKAIVMQPPKEVGSSIQQASTIVNQQAENIHNTNTVNNTNNTNNNIVVFHFNNDPLPLHYDHITQKMISQLFNGSAYPIDSIRNYAHKVLERPENLCVKKKHIRDPHTLVHVGDNKWEARVDKEVFPRLTYNISSNLLEYIEAAQRKIHFSERLEEILNDVVSEKNPYYKDITNRIKLMVIDFTKTLLETDKQ